MDALPNCSDGTSPPTRGKPGVGVGLQRKPRNIPAHTGKTKRKASHHNRNTEHPRPHGENVRKRNYSSGTSGTSPPTRGKLMRGCGRQGRGRNIPAHTGKTGRGCRAGPARPEHPRPHGENLGEYYTGGIEGGTSPPTRGKPGTGPVHRHHQRNIPAHTGKTTRAGWAAWGCSEHPRPHGENRLRGLGQRLRHGTSPPTRGKRCPPQSRHQTGRNIPAHTGKTTGEHGRCARAAEHPRPHGENVLPKLTECYLRGTSPPTRGKRQPDQRGGGGLRNIPAHTGKTRASHRWTSAWKEHPRPHGENDRYRCDNGCDAGTSPPTRGKPHGPRAHARRRRNIPAHTGKTVQHFATDFVKAEHPRPHGENYPLLEQLAGQHGTSPPTRGKRRKVGPQQRAERNIPAHTGKTRVEVID